MGNWATWAALALLMVPGALLDPLVAGQGAQSAGLVVDLATTLPGTTRLVAPVTGSLFDVSMINRAPGVPYRITVRVSGRNPVTRELPSALYPRLPLEGPCEELQRVLFDLVETTDESQVPARIDRLRSEGGRIPCQALPTSQPIQILTVERQSLVVGVGDELHLLIERLSRDGHDVTKAWEIILGGAVARLEGDYASEEEWIVASIVREIGLSSASRPNGLAPTVKVKPASEPDQVVVHIEGPRGYDGRVQLAPHVWAPGAYLPVATALIGRGAPTRSRTSGPGPLQRLTDLRATTIADEAEAVSKRLDRTPLDPDLHEQAALVLAALALREHAGPFSDNRLLLCRITARLAVAAALRHGMPPSADGEVAGVVLLTLVGRTAEAQTLATTLADRPEPGLSAWGRALALRATGDWRALKEPAQPTQLERLEYVRALKDGRGTSAALEFLDGAKPEPVADWGRILLDGRISIEAGNRFGPMAVQAELTEAEAVRGRLLGSRLPNADLVRDLNAQIGTRLGPAEVQRSTSTVIDWGTWAGSYQRHALAQAWRQSVFLKEGLRLRQEAAGQWKTMVATFGPWRAFPFLDLLVSQRNESELSAAATSATASQDPTRVARGQTEAACATTLPVLLREPDVVPAALWSAAENACFAQRERGELPAFDAWFREELLPGTTFDASARLLVGSISRHYAKGGEAAWGALRQLAPFDSLILASYVDAHVGDHGKASAILEAYGPVSEYQLPVLRRVARDVQKDEPLEYEKLLGRLCALERDNCFEYGGLVADLGRTDEAAAIYKDAFDGARNRVEASAQADWLVDYYVDRGRREEALTVARAAAEVYSGPGLLTLASLLERLGQYDEALRYYETHRDRYQVDDDINAFYVRAFLKRGDARYKEQSERALGSLFPSGMARISMADLPRQPTSGVRILDETTLSKKLALATNDVIVSLDGYRVDTYPQYKLIRSLNDDPLVRLIVWHQGKYVEIEAQLPNRRFGSQLTTYPR